MKIYLETKRIYLREFVATDNDLLWQLDSDPEVMRYLTNGKASSRKNILEKMERVAELLKSSSGKFGVWAALKKETDDFIGWFHLFPPPTEPENVKKLFLGYRLQRKYWGQGYATEVSKALVEKAFNVYHASEVCAQAMKTNLASQKVMSNVGMSFVSEYKETAFPVESQAAVLFSILRPN